MKLKRALAVALMTIMAAGTAGCGETAVSEENTAQDNGAEVAVSKEDEQVATAAAPASDAEGIRPYADLVLGEDFTDLNTEISFFSNRYQIQWMNRRS